MKAKTPAPKKPQKAYKYDDNSDPYAKELIRNWLLAQLGGPKKTRVLELYGGMGHLHDACYADPPVKKHMAFELRKVDRPTWLQGDNRVLLQSHAKGWDLYDIDAYASPWLIANDVCRLREDGPFAMALTDGMFRSLLSGQANPYVREATGIAGLPPDIRKCLSYFYNPVLVSLLMNDWKRWGVRVTQAKFMVTNKKPFQSFYFGVMCMKDSKTATEDASKYTDSYDDAENAGIQGASA